MSEKKRAKKGIDSLKKQVEIHKSKLAKAREEGNIGLANYYEKEIEHFEQTIEKLKHRLMPKLKRKKSA